MNLPNAITIARIAATPLVAALPFVDAWEARLAAFVLFVVAAVSDYVDGRLARSRNLVTDLGRLLDPLADKLFLLGTFVPMYLLVGSGLSASLLAPHAVPLVPEVPLGPVASDDAVLGDAAFPFATPVGRVGLPLWIVLVVLGRELVMTLFRQAAARRGVVIAAIGPAKLKTGFQSTWVGASFFWFFLATLAAEQRWRGPAWEALAHFNGIVVVVTMAVAVLLTVWSLWLYVRRYGGVLRGAGAPVG